MPPTTTAHRPERKLGEQGAELEIRCPADGHVAGHLPLAGPSDVAAVAARLRDAQANWEAIGPEGRGRWVSLWRDWIIDNSQRLLMMVQEESGKSWGDANIEIQACLEVMNHYIEHAAEFLKPERRRPHNLVASIKRLRLNYRPHPLVGVISPWNYPLAMPMLDIPAPLMAGCAVLSKPSEVTPLAWTEAVRGWDEIGAPAVLACVNGRGDTGTAVVDEVDMVQFTGSVETGRRVAERAASRLIPCCLELGGKDPMIVLADADIERAVNGAVWGGMFNAGQSCVAVERIYVEASAYEQFLARLTERVRELRQGMDRPGEYGTDLGATATEEQLEKIVGHVDDAVAKGAHAVVGGSRGEGGIFYRPTVLVDVDHSMEVMREETFGPVLPVMRVADEEEAIRLANDSRYGLSASIWTADEERAQRVAARLEVGGVNVNDVMMNVFQFSTPHGGWRESGVGSRYGGPDGIRKYCRAQAVVSGRLPVAPSSEVHWYPHSPANGRFQAKIARVLGARDWRRRLGLKQRSETR